MGLGGKRYISVGGEDTKSIHKKAHLGDMQPLNAFDPPTRPLASCIGQEESCP